MKIRVDFVTNSSSSSFLIINLSDKPKTMIDFVEENWDQLSEYMSWYGYEYTKEEIIESLKQYYPHYMYFEPKECKSVIFGDEDGTVAGRVFDYILRYFDGTENWECYLKELLR